MGHKYTKIYSHSTIANLEFNKLNNLYKWPTTIKNVYDQLGSQYCHLFNNYPGKTRCKLCLGRMDNKPVVMLKCSLKHRYHAECFVDHIKDFECLECRKLLSQLQIPD